MKHILLLILLAATSMMAQTNYINGVAYMIILNEQMEVLKEIPMGKDVLISYDKFYDSYDIMMTAEDGMMSFNLDYVNTDDRKKVYIDKDSSQENDFFYAEDRLLDERKLFLIQFDTKVVNGETLRLVYRFESFK